MTKTMVSDYLGYGDLEGLSDEEHLAYLEDLQDLEDEAIERMERDHVSGCFDSDD